MKYRSLGKSGIQISEVSFGAWAAGGTMWGGRRDESSLEAMRHAIEKGVNFFDSALVYGDGHSEQLVGKVVKENNTKNLYVASKIPPKAMRWPAPATAKLEEYFPARWITQCCERSLKHFGLDRIDLLQLHVWADAWTDQDEWYQTMLRLRQEGKINLIGISINSHDPQSALRVAKSGRVDALQVFYNIFDQSPEDELFPTCQEYGVGVLARVPFDEGSLTGKLREDTVFPSGDFRTHYFGRGMLAETVRRVESLRPIVENSANSMARGALRYCLSHSAVTAVIPGMRNIEQVNENTAASADGPLPNEALQKLKAHRWVRPAYS